jgi:tyrosyl-DNA phosphodiesterase 2
VDVGTGEDRILRLCNTHAESLALEPAYRPPQLALCARYMHESTVNASVLAGDLNAIQDFDKHLHTDNNLKDAYLDLGGQEDDAEGHTWGQQAATAQRERFGTTRSKHSSTLASLTFGFEY